MNEKHILGRLRRRYQGYSGARPDVIGMVPSPPTRVLDVGCGAGVSADLLRESYPNVFVVGVESDQRLAEIAGARMDSIIEGPVDSEEVISRLVDGQPFDLILCADVLEHLHDPWLVLRELVGCLAPMGSLITSIPNVRHVSTFTSLGFQGVWPRRTRGIHDRTHLRFFARKDVLELGTRAGLELVKERRNLRLVESRAWTSIPAKAFDFWPLRGFLTFQYLHLWRAKDV